MELNRGVRTMYAIQLYKAFIFVNLLTFFMCTVTLLPYANPLPQIMHWNVFLWAMSSCVVM